MFRSPLTLRGGIVIGTSLVVAATTYAAVGAATFDYVTTSSPIPALTSYYSAIRTHTGNTMHTCQNPTFAAAIYLTTTGGTQIRRVDGNCPLANTVHAPESSTRANCVNKATTAKYAGCTEYYI